MTVSFAAFTTSAVEPGIKGSTVIFPQYPGTTMEENFTVAIERFCTITDSTRDEQLNSGTSEFEEAMRNSSKGWFEPMKVSTDSEGSETVPSAISVRIDTVFSLLWESLIYSDPTQFSSFIKFDSKLTMQPLGFETTAYSPLPPWTPTTTMR